MPSIESNKPNSSSQTSAPSFPEDEISGKTEDYRNVSPIKVQESIIQVDNATQGTETITTGAKSITPAEAGKLLGEKHRLVPDTPGQALEDLLSMDGELAKFYQTNTENHYISESDRALKSLMEHINSGDLNNNLSDKKNLNIYKNLIRELNLPKNLKISLTIDPGGSFCLIPVNNSLMTVNNLKQLINTAIKLTQKIKDTRTSHQNPLKTSPSRKEEILNNINLLLIQIKNREPFIARLDEIKNPRVCITTDSKLWPHGEKGLSAPKDELIISNIHDKNITPETIDKLVNRLKKHREKVQSFIHSTQRLWLENGPDTKSIISAWPEIEGGVIEGHPLQLARQLISSDSAHVSTELSEITDAIDRDIAGLRKYLQDAPKYDFRSGEQYLKQINLYEQLVIRLAGQQSTEQKTAEKLASGMAIINRKKTIAQTGPGMTAECVPETIKELTKLDKELRKLFNVPSFFDKSPSLYDRELINLLEKNSQSFSSRLHIYQHDRWQEVTLEYTPAAAMRQYNDHSDSAATGQGDRDPFGHSYDGKLALSLQRDSQHAVNMLACTMKVDGQETARHIRVGCPYAYREKGENIDKITNQRLDEIFTALLLHNHKQALQEAMANPDHKPIELDCLYLNLMSPDYIRDSGLAGMVGMDNEKQWIEKLHEKLLDLSGKDHSLTIYHADGTPSVVKIRPQPVMFVSPCNKLAFPNEHKPLASKALMAAANTWETVHKVNGTALTQLLGEDHQNGGLLAKKLPELSASEQQKAQQLANELWTLYKTGGGLKQVAEQRGPFYFSGKLKELSIILGIDLFTGCKSNKDRTGISEAYQQSLLTSGTPDLTEQFMVYGGHVMIQMRNTGLPGYRLDGTQARQLDNAIFSKLTRH